MGPDQCRTHALPSSISVDKNGDGSVDWDELRELMGIVMGKPPTNEQVTRLGNMCDENGDGVIQEQELVDALEGWCVSSTMPILPFASLPLWLLLLPHPYNRARSCTYTLTSSRRAHSHPRLADADEAALSSPKAKRAREGDEPEGLNSPLIRRKVHVNIKLFFEQHDIDSGIQQVTNRP